jgi:hypothetical protein
MSALFLLSFVHLLYQRFDREKGRMYLLLDLYGDHLRMLDESIFLPF